MPIHGNSEGLEMNRTRAAMGMLIVISVCCGTPWGRPSQMRSEVCSRGNCVIACLLGRETDLAAQMEQKVVRFALKWAGKVLDRYIR
jgi:hypothetical protein